MYSKLTDNLRSLNEMPWIEVNKDMVLDLELEKKPSKEVLIAKIKAAFEQADDRDDVLASLLDVFTSLGRLSITREELIGLSKVEQPVAHAHENIFESDIFTPISKDDDKERTKELEAKYREMMQTLYTYRKGDRVHVAAFDCDGIITHIDYKVDLHMVYPIVVKLDMNNEEVFCDPDQIQKLRYGQVQEDIFTPISPEDRDQREVAIEKTYSAMAMNDLIEALYAKISGGLRYLTREDLDVMIAAKLSKYKGISKEKALSILHAYLDSSAHETGHIPEGQQDTLAFLLNETSKDTTFKSRLGKCYELSGRYVMEHPEAVLVHGTITRKDGYTIDHAWTETSQKMDKWDIKIVFDPVLGYELPKDAYDRILGAKEKNRFTHEELMTKVLKSKNWGPWESKLAEDIFTPISKEDNAHRDSQTRKRALEKLDKMYAGLDRIGKTHNSKAMINQNKQTYCYELCDNCHANCHEALCPIEYFVLTEKEKADYACPYFKNGGDILTALERLRLKRATLKEDIFTPVSDEDSAKREEEAKIAAEKEWQRIAALPIGDELLYILADKAYDSYSESQTSPTSQDIWHWVQDRLMTLKGISSKEAWKYTGAYFEGELENLEEGTNK